MKTTTISDFRRNLKDYVDTVISSNEPVLINRGRQGAVLVSLEEYNALARTESILSSKMSEGILASVKEQEFIEVEIDTL